MIDQKFLSSNRNLTGIEKLKNIYHDVILDTQTSIIYDQDFQFIEECLYEVLYWGANIPGKWLKVIPGPIINSQDQLKAELDNRKKIIKDEIALLRNEKRLDITYLEPGRYFFALHPTGWYPYGHLHDSLNRLYPWREIDKNDGDKLLVSRINKVNDFHLHCLSYGFEEDQIIECGKVGRFLRIPTLYFGVNPSFYTSFTPDCYRWVRSGYAKVFNRLIDKKGKFRLYLDRNHVKGGKRGVINNEDVKQLLIQEGFKIVTGQETLKEIYSLFSNAEIIVGSHGSLFVNTIFSDSSCKIIEFCPSNRPDFSFKNKYKDAVDYMHILVDGDGDFNIKIDLDELFKLINKK
jgi:hypothetical protein